MRKRSVHFTSKLKVEKKSVRVFMPIDHGHTSNADCAQCVRNEFILAVSINVASCFFLLPPRTRINRVDVDFGSHKTSAHIHITHISLL